MKLQRIIRLKNMLLNGYKALTAAIKNITHFMRSILLTF